ncbi:MAG: GDP-mannose 4,6-dehydratase [Candidatus Micrarchaeota archaeon]
MRVLITGGCGFIGSHLSGALLRRGDDVVCIDNFDPYYAKEVKMRNLALLRKEKRFAFEEMDVRDAGVCKLMKEHSIERVVHLAARAGVRPSLALPFVYEEINVKGTLNMLEAAAANNIGNFIFISSSSVYGNCPTTPWKEEYEPLPASPYGASKLAGEAYVRTYSELYGLATSCLRYFSIYGPRQRPDLALVKFTDSIMKGKQIEMFGDGTTMRDYTYVSDAVDGTISALDKKFKYEVFNIGNSDPVQLKRLINILEQKLKRKAAIRQLPEQKGDLKNTYADISKARKMLGYSPKVKIEEGIGNYLDWLQKK